MTHVTRWVRLALMLAVLFAGAAATGVFAPNANQVAAADPASCLDATEAQFLKLINNYRASKGLPALKASKSLNVASYKHSYDMGKRGYFAHNTPSPLPAGQSGPLPWDRMKDAGYGYSTSKAENIAAGQSTAEKVFNSWKNSAGHNANMLSTKFKVIGIGFAPVSGSKYGYYWTTKFGGYADGATTCS